jgi:hypothetical protein
MNSHFGSWSANGLLNLQRVIVGVKNHWIELYHWKILRMLMSKMSLHDPFGHLKYKLWSKEQLGIKLPICFPTTKSRELPYFICLHVACHILLESSWQGLKLCFKFHFNWRFAQKLMGFQSCGSPNFKNFKNFETPKLGVLGQNDIWVQALWPGIENTIRGKVVPSPKFGSWWVLWVHVYSWLVRAPKVLQLCINQLVVWFVTIIDSLVIFFSPHFGTPTHLLPQKCAS